MKKIQAAMGKKVVANSPVKKAVTKPVDMKVQGKKAAVPVKGKPVQPKVAPQPVARKPRPVQKPEPENLPPSVLQAVQSGEMRILEQLAALQTAVAQLARPKAPEVTVESTPLVDSGTTALRRLLSDLLESRTEQFLGQLVQLRSRIASGRIVDPPAIVERMDVLLEDMGAIRYDAAKLDSLDPLIHEAVGERNEAEVPEGCVVEMAQPGFRSGRGVVLQKACVIVSRRS